MIPVAVTYNLESVGTLQSLPESLHVYSEQDSFEIFNRYGPNPLSFEK